MQRKRGTWDLTWCETALGTWNTAWTTSRHSPSKTLVLYRVLYFCCVQRRTLRRNLALDHRICLPFVLVARIGSQRPVVDQINRQSWWQEWGKRTAFVAEAVLKKLRILGQNTSENIFRRFFRCFVLASSFLLFYSCSWSQRDVSKERVIFIHLLST